MYPPRALIVDDDPTLVQVLATHLTKLGFEAHGCASQADALAYLAEERPTLLVVDIKLPDGDGLDLCLHPNLDESLRLVITGHPSAKASDRCHRLGAQLLLKTGELWRQMQPLVRQHLGLPLTV